MKFVIDRSKWLRGEGSTASKLLRSEDGKMCCVGQILEQCGMASRLLQDTAAAHDIPAYYSSGRIYDFLRSCDTELYEANDKEQLTDAEREERISAQLAKEGVEVEFIN